jgi:hypothetical protein
VSDILKIYPESTVYLDMISGNSETIADTTKRLYFVFQNKEGKQVGNYSQDLQPSKPKNLSLQADWIIIGP